LRQPDDAPIPYSLTRTGRGGWPLELKIRNKKAIAPAGRRTNSIFSDKDRSGRGPLELEFKKEIIKRFRLPDDAPIPISLARTGRGGGPLELKIKKKIRREIAPAGRRTDSIYSDKEKSGRVAARAQK
jgi:hypothetical protein